MLALGVAGSAFAQVPVPAVSGVSVSPSAAFLMSMFGRGERIRVSATFGRAVAVTVTPRLALNIGTETRQADYARSGVTFGGRSVLYFEYAVQVVDSDPTGISIAATALTLNSGTMVATAADATRATLVWAQGNRT